jgi:hypothetical protein
MRRIVCIIAISAALVSCKSGFYHVQTAIRFAYPIIDTFGPYVKDWVVADLREIVALAKARSGIRKPIDQIEVDQRDHAKIKSGNSQNQGDPLTTFEVRRLNGHWTIVPDTVSTGPAIITS